MENVVSETNVSKKELIEEKNLLNPINFNDVNNIEKDLGVVEVQLDNVIDLDKLNAFNEENYRVDIKLNDVAFSISLEEDIRKIQQHHIAYNVELDGFAMTSLALRKLADIVEATKCMATLSTVKIPLNKNNSL
ncbi:MAG: hypothetical protein QXG00_07290 [Candidatus Woesearchaeota archaeon]